MVLLVQILITGFVLYASRDSKTLSPQELKEVEEALEKGSEAHTNGELDLAEASYNEALEIDPDNEIAYYNLGVLEEGKGPASRSEEYYRRSLQANPDFVPALYNLAVQQDAAGDPHEARDLYRKIIRLEPAHPEAHLNLGFILIRKFDQVDEGRRELLRAIVLDERLATRVSSEDLGT